MGVSYTAIQRKMEELNWPVIPHAYMSPGIRDGLQESALAFTGKEQEGIMNRRI